MASKRHLESLDPVIFNKLPRLETEPAAGFPNGLCKSSPVPNPGSENHFNYKGSYFACPLQSPDGPEQPLKPVAVNKAAPLAVPKPVYRAPACSLDPRRPLPLGPRAESLQQRPGDADWALPAAAPTSHPLRPGEPRSGTGLHKRGPHSDPSLPPLHPSLALPAKEKVGSPIAFSPYYAAFEKYRAPPGSPFLPASCPAAHSQRKAPDAALLYHPPAPSVEAQPSTLPGAYKGFGFAGSGEPFPCTYLKPQAPRSYFPGPLDTYVPRAAGAGVVASPPAKSAALPREKVPGGSGGLAETFPKGEGGWVKPSRGEQEPPYPGRRRASPAPQESPRGGPPAPITVGGDTCKVKDTAKELIPPSPAASPPEGLKVPRDGEVSPSSPPMPVINNVFSLAPYRDYLEGTEGSAQVPFSKEHLRGNTPPRIAGSSCEPAALGDTSSSAVQSQGENCYGRVPEKPKLVPQDPGSQRGSPGGVGSGEPAPEDVALDLSLKKRLVKAGETQGPVGRREGTPDGEGAEEEKEGPEGKTRTSAGQYFATLHTSLCDIISCSVSRSSPELLREWLKKAEPAEELGEMPKSPPKPKNGSKIPEPQKPTKGKEIWLAFQDVAALLTNLLSQLETFMFARKCPFPHVVRAGAVFIPIHVVKEKLFPKLAGASVDQVLQEHKVELRPTTLSEERHLRDLELKSCTSRMLKLLALKQLPDIYPDLLNLHWHDSIRQQLGSSSQAGQHPPK
ncbi:PREDICTED: uncharacterized protein C15orf39 homolog [Aptenodytes forsteri]|nr:PREDICTED: uncharacterized protein C15orf39 homolog [Aptenodytes forsteri]